MMTTNSAALFLLLLAALAATARAVPWFREGSICSKECSVTGSPKFGYAAGSTYSYDYTGKSEVRVNDGAALETRWSALVKLSWMTPCDMAISVSGFKLEGTAEPDEARFLERYPLVVAVTDGRVQHVCSHPDDNVWAINFKKGIASAFQNTLPSLSTVNSRRVFEETDVVGRCPTDYEVLLQPKAILVEREKSHRLCRERYPTPAETPVPWLKGLQSLGESRSSCVQMIQDGIYSAIKCGDYNVVRATYGAHKHVLASQESSLQYLSNSTHSMPSLSDLSLARLVHGRLLYDYEPPKKEPALVPELNGVLAQMCHEAGGSVQRRTASLVAEAVGLLRRVPDEAAEEALETIRNGEGFRECRVRLEGLFLDAVASVHEPGAVRVMVRELTEGRGRSALYAASLLQVQRPNADVLQSLRRLFESPRHLPLATLAASSVVNTYCRHWPNCEEDPVVEVLVRALMSKVHGACSSSSSPRQEQEVLTTLKALGNMGVLTQEATQSLLSCVKSEQAQLKVRVAAVQAFRQARCHVPVTEQLVTLAVDPHKPTEIRIQSYLMAVRCSHKIHLDKIVAHISAEQNTQVRAFILSHLGNLKQSNAPDKKRLRYLLEDVVVPTDFEKDVRRYSRNIDLSYISPASDFGGGVEANIIYAPGSYVPRSVDVSFTAPLEGALVNVGEIGVRFQGLEPAIEDLFGPGGHLNQVSFARILNDVERFLSDVVSGRRSLDINGLSDILSRVSNGDLAQVDVFARYMGQELTFVSVVEDLKNMGSLQEAVLQYLDFIKSYVSYMGDDFARAGQLRFDYSFPTIQGTPFKIQFEGTAAVDLKMRWMSQSEGKYSMEFSPKLSIDSKGFVGFDGYLFRTGLKTRNSLSSQGGVSVRASVGKEVELYLDIPNQMEIVSAEWEAFLFKDGPDRKVVPGSLSDVVGIRKKSCIDFLKDILGLRICYDIDVPDVFRYDALPLVPKSFVSLSIEKVDPAMRGYLVNAGTQDTATGKAARLKVAALGSSVPREGEAVVFYTMNEYVQEFYARLSSPAIGFEARAKASTKGGQRDVQLHGQYVAGERVVYGVRAGLQARSESGKDHYELGVYSSQEATFPPEAKVVEGRLTRKQEGPLTLLDVSYRTKNALRKYLEMDCKISTEVRDTLRLSVKQLKFHGGLGGWRVTSTLNRTRESDQRLRYQSAFRFSHDEVDLGSAQAVTTAEGTFGRDLEIKNSFTVAIGSRVYKSSCDVYCGTAKLGASLSVRRSSDGSVIAHTEALLKRSDESVKTTIEVDLPEYMTAISISGRVANLGTNQYGVAASLRQGEGSVFRVEGPVTLSFSPELSFATNLTLAALASGPYTLSALVSLPPSTNVVSLELRREEMPVLALDWRADAGPPKTALKFRVSLGGSLYDIEADAGDGDVTVSLDARLFLESSRPRRIKSSVSLGLEPRELKAQLFWDADRDEGKMVGVEGSFVTSPEHRGHVSIPFSVTWMTQTYRVEADVTVDKLPPGYTGAYGFNLTVNTPSQRTFVLGVNSCVLQGDSSVLAHSHVNYKSLDDFGYNVTNILEIEYSREPQGFLIHNWLNATESSAQERALNVEFEIEKAPEKFFTHAKIIVWTPDEKDPLKIELVSDMHDDAQRIEWKAGSGSPVTLFSWDVATNGPEGIQSMESKADMTAIRNVLGAFFNSVPPNESGQHEVYRLTYDKPQTSTSYLKLQQLSLVPGNATSSSLATNPDRDEGDVRFEIGLRYSRNYWGGERSYQGHISHQSLTRDLTAGVKYTANEDRLSGAFTLDLFPGKADAIQADFDSTWITTNSLKIVLNFSSRERKASPQVTIVLAHSYDTTGIDVKYQRTPSSPVSFDASVKYDQFAPGGSAMAVVLKNETGVFLDLSGLLKSQETPECKGWESEVALSSPLGYYDVYVELCRPAFLQVVTKKGGSGQAFVTRLGYREPREVEGSVSRLDQHGQHAIVMAKVAQRLSALTVDVAHEREEWDTVKSIVQEECQKVVRSAKVWAGELFASLVEESRLEELDLPVVSQLLRDARRGLLALCRELGDEILLKVVRSRVVSGAVDFASGLFLRLADMQRAVGDLITSEVVAWEDKFSWVVEAIKDAAMQMVLWMEFSMEPEAVQDLMERLDRYEVFKAAKRALEDFVSEHREEFDAFLRVAEKVKRQLNEDALELLKEVFQTPSALKDVDWLVTNYNSGHLEVAGVEKLVSRLLQAVGFVSVEKEGSHVTVHIPLYRPFSALARGLEGEANPLSVLVDTLWQSVPFALLPIGNLVRSYEALIPERLADVIPPFNRTATVLGGSEVLTFDGALLHRVPRSPCEVLLASYRSSKVIMSHPTPSSRERVSVIVDSTNVTVEPDFRVMINGREMTGSKETQGQITVHNADNQVMVSTPYISVWILKNQRAISVEASGWTFGHIAGLLGSNDGEVGNDWLMPSGQLASSPQELASSWELDQRCLGFFYPS